MSMKKRKTSFLIRIMSMVTVPVILLGIILNVFADIKFYEEGHEALENRISDSAAFTSMFLNPGAIEKNQDALDYVKENNGYYGTVFFDNGAYDATSFTKEENMEIIDVIIHNSQLGEKLLNGSGYFVKNVKLDGESWELYFQPVSHLGESEQGILVLGVKTDELIRNFRRFSGQVLIATLLLLVAAFYMSIKNGLRITRHVRAVEAHIDSMSKGDLSKEMDKHILKRRDELGDMARKLNVLKMEWRKMIACIIEKSQDLSEASGVLSEDSIYNARIAVDFSRALDDIAKGSMSHAQETQASLEQMKEVGEVIETTYAELSTLIDNAGNMRNAGDRASITISELFEMNENTIHSIEKISKQTTITSESVNQISEAVSIINSIASQTSLLALNASIEAARAGEDGRGFAVVAGEIQNLAEQTNASVKQIDKTIQKLLSESNEMVVVMEEVNHTVQEQTKKCLNTKHEFEEVSEGIVSSVVEIQKVQENFGRIEHAKAKIVQALTVLANLAQESAATTQEATASCEELSGKTEGIAQSSVKLDDISKELNQTVESFIME